jgi:S-DNA-T family DNA segregation ATPase FtsK/SpoIIIE
VQSLHLSPERKLDLLGTFLALVGLLTLLSLLSARRGSLTGWWVSALSQGVGWGMFVLPLGLLGVGLWLVLRNVSKLPQVAVERLVGLVFLYWNLLAWLHLFAGGGYDLAAAGKGGGYVGAWVEETLVHALGIAGCTIVLSAWLLITLTMTLDLSITEIFRWVTPLVEKARMAMADARAARAAAVGDEPLALEDLDSNFTPFDRSNLPVELTADARPAAAPGTQTAPAAVEPMEPVHLIPPSTPWELPAVDAVLEAGLPAAVNGEVDAQRAHLIEETLQSFGAPAHVVEIHRGPTVTQFGVEPDFIENRSGRTRVRVSKIVSLADDLALALAASRIRIQAPVPGRAYVGIEVPNEEVSRVVLRDVIESEHFQKIRSPLRFALGKDVSGASVSADLASMPHLLIAGTTGSGKSVCVNAILSCLLINNTPDDLRLILVDPKRVELTGYNGVPHLLAPVVVDVDKVTGALQWMLREMDNRYHKFAQLGARNIIDFNSRLTARGERKIPYLVVVIDELADLMMLAPDETERSITRLAQLARATGIHMIIATQRPSVDVLTGLIKANFPARIAFAVASGVDSRVILDQPGAERLLGRGDMLFQAPDAPAPVRLQGVFVSEGEIQRMVEYWREFAARVNPPAAADGSPSASGLPVGAPLKQVPLWDDMVDMEPEKAGDPLYDDAVDLVRREGRASISMLQRRMRIGYTRAARLIDTMEDKGIIGEAQSHTQVREVLDYGPAAPPKEE